MTQTRFLRWLFIASFSLASVAASGASTLLEEDFDSYADDAALDVAWPKAANAITYLGEDPESPGTPTLFSKGDRRHRIFGPITPTDDEPLYLRIDYYDDYAVGVPGREYIGLWAGPLDHGSRMIEVGLHNHDVALDTSTYTARVVGSPHGFGWFDLNTPRVAGWRLLEIWVFADSVKIHFDGVLDTVVNWAGGELGTVRLGFGAGDATTASQTGVHYKNLLIEQREVFPSYETAFGASEGYTVGSLQGQDGWVVEQGTASVITDGGTSQTVVLDPSTLRSRISRDFTEFAAEPVVFVDFSVRGGAGEPPSNAPEASAPETFHVAIVAEEDVGRFYVFDGDGAGSGTWVSTAAVVPVDVNGQLLSWSVVTVRLDYIRATFDLYVDGIIAGFDYGFMFDDQLSFSRFVLSGNPEMEVLLDDFFAAPVPIIWENKGRDGIADWWKSLHGFSLTTDIRDLNPYQDGITNIARFFHQTGFETEPEGVVVFYDDFESGSLANWSEWSVNSTLAISTDQNRTAHGAHSAILTNSAQKMYRSLGTGVQGEASVTFWMYDDMGGQTRWFGEARTDFQQIFAIGRYGVVFGSGTGTLAGEMVDSTGYQGRVFSGTNAGWFNLNAPGAPRRSPGWHKFEIKRLADGTTVEFYVDNILSRTITDATYVPIGSVTIGAGVGTALGNAWFDDVRVEYSDLPVFLTQPSSAIRNAGGSVVFHAPSSGNVQGYQWQFNGQDIPGATSPSLFRSNLSPSQAGEYRLAVTNGVGTTISEPAYLAVVSEEPGHNTVNAGETVVFSVDAGGVPFLTYEWLRAGVPLMDGPRISGVTTPNLTLADVWRDDEGAYTVVLSVPGAQFETRPGLLGVNANIVFNDDFSSGSLSNWNQVPSSTNLSISTSLQNPLGSGFTAHLSSSRGKMYHNLATDVGGHARAVFWIYDNGESTGVRWLGEVRAYETDGFSANDKLEQVFAIGKYHVGFGGGTGTLAGETLKANKYQGRVGFGANAGWFNLDAPGSPNVSVGWRKFEIERMHFGTTINFYVDGILCRTITEADYAEWDVAMMGSVGHFSTNPVDHDAWFGGVTVEYFDVPTDIHGIPDYWKEFYFGHADHDAYDDPSGSGYPLLYEYHHNTDPTDPESVPVANYVVDRSVPLNGTTVFHDIKPAIDQAKIDGVDYRIIEVAPGVYEGPNNRLLTIENVKMLLIAREGPDQTIVQFDGHTSTGISVTSESAIVGFTFRDSDGTFITIQDVDAGLLGNCRFGGHIHYHATGVEIERSSFLLRDNVFLTGGAVLINNDEWPEVDRLVRVVSSRFENHYDRALSVQSGRLHVRDSHFEGNQASSGAGVFLSAVTYAEIENTRFTGNRATGAGGAIDSQGLELKLLNCDFINNTAGGDGGAISGYGSSKLVMEDSFFSGNRAESSSARGGALYWSASEATISGSYFFNNESSEGGGAYVTGGEQEIVNSVFVGNRAETRGGGIAAFPGGAKQFHLISSTVVGNELVSEDSGATLEGAGVFATLAWWSADGINLLNSIVWNDGPNLVIDDNSSPQLVDVSYSNIRQDSGTYPGTGNLNVEPMLRPDGLLLAGSPMINAGTATGAPGYDIHGEARPHGGGVDIGADEFVDTDGLGLPNWWQLLFFGALGQNPNADPDGDGLTNSQEYAFVIDPTNRDTSGDGVGDGDSPDDDYNWDTIPSWLAVLIGLDPYETDHSGNGVTNFEALAFGADPFDPEEFPSQTFLPHDPVNPPVITLHEPTNAVLLN